jgi:hypothetical protein
MDFTNVGDISFDPGSFFQATPTAQNNVQQIFNNAVGGLVTSGLQKLLGTTPSTQTGSQIYQGAPMVMDVYGRAQPCGTGRKVCKISRAKNPKNPHYGKPVCPRMNPLNPKALGRAVRRLSGFQHFAVKTEKAIQASFRKAGVFPHRRAASGGRCGTCRKTKCSCG